MITKDFISFINEEVGFRNLRKIAEKYQTAEIYFHQDLDGVCSALSMKFFLEKYYNIKVVNTHIIQYGAIEYAVKHTKKNNLPIIVDYAHSKVGYILFDHHDKQSGADTAGGVYAKPSRSNAEIISGEISYSDVFLSTDVKLIQTVDSADFLKYNLQPEDIQRAVLGIDKNLGAERNRFLMGLVVNRLLLSMKSKRITVNSLDGQRTHENRNLLECLVLDATPSLYSLYINLSHYIKNATSLEWDRSKRNYDKEATLSTPEELTRNLQKYIKSRKRFIESESGQKVKHPDIDFDDNYKIIKQYGIGRVFDPGSYDRYVVFKNFPEADFVCTIFPMGLIQVSCNPFKEKKLKGINLGAIAKEVLAKYKYQLTNLRIGIADIKRISEDEISKMKAKYGQKYKAMGFRMSDLKSLYKNSIVYLPNKESGDLKTRGILNLDDDEIVEVQLLQEWMDLNYAEWPYEVAEEINLMKVPLLDIITQSSGGHPSITNIQGLNYMSTRKDLLSILFKTDKYTDVMKLLADDFIELLKAKIDAEKSGKTTGAGSVTDIELKGTINVD